MRCTSQSHGRRGKRELSSIGKRAAAAGTSASLGGSSNSRLLKFSFVALRDAMRDRRVALALAAAAVAALVVGSIHMEVRTAPGAPATGAGTARPTATGWHAGERACIQRSARLCKRATAAFLRRRMLLSGPRASLWDCRASRNALPARSVNVSPEFTVRASSQRLWSRPSSFRAASRRRVQLGGSRRPRCTIRSTSPSHPWSRIR
jgi:hypothetical protein